MTTRNICRWIGVSVALATAAMATAALASPLKTRACPGAVIVAGDGVLINRPPLIHICNPSA